MEPKPKPNENSPPNKNLPNDSPHKEKPKATLSSRLSSKLKGFEFKKRDHDGPSDSSKDESSELQHKDKKARLEHCDKEKPPKDKKDSPFKKETPQKEVKIKTEEGKSVREEKSEKNSKNVSRHSSKGEKISPVKKDNEIKTEKATATPEKVTPKKPTKEESQAVDTTPQEEKKMAARNSYLKFLKRSGPANPGSKSIPEVSIVFLAS